ncbi:MAG: UDP-N-acetylmuramate dehydrogenase [Chitinophagales bacterium]|nr:UDP-N-acetylmuramate dehydrogenase [Chitinophagales bacterium]
MQLLDNISLKPFNTFGIDVKARQLATFTSLNDLESINIKPGTIVLGGGSNILFTKDVDGMVLKNEITGIRELHEDEEYVYVKAGAGENWHRFVLYCIDRNWAGIENLSLIPGSVGASPMQNIGAYGVELENVFWNLEAWHVQERKLVNFTRSDCEFGYRESVFKRKYKNQFIITSVTYRLYKTPIFHTSYGAIEQELERMGVKALSIKAISDAVINIRSSKLPDPKLMGNAGSFFKNPSVTDRKFLELKQRFEGIVGYRNPDGSMKIAAGWLIEQCGWKGFRRGDAGCHAKQALVLVNYGNAKGIDICQLSDEIIQSVKDKFAVELEKEVNIF